MGYHSRVHTQKMAAAWSQDLLVALDSIISLNLRTGSCSLDLSTANQNCLCTSTSFVCSVALTRLLLTSKPHFYSPYRRLIAALGPRPSALLRGPMVEPSRFKGHDRRGWGGTDHHQLSNGAPDPRSWTKVSNVWFWTKAPPAGAASCCRRGVSCFYFQPSVNKSMLK